LHWTKHAGRSAQGHFEGTMAESEDHSENSTATSPTRRVIKRYSNRKLYDTKDSKYVTLLEIAEQIRAGEDIQVIDNASKEDKTEVTLALIISEELKTQPRGIPQATLKSLIRERGGKWLNQLREGPIGKLMPKDLENALIESPYLDKPEDRGLELPQRETLAKGIRATLEQWQATIDERIRAIIPNAPSLSEIQGELARLSDRIGALEARVANEPHNDQTK
jgi:polyhydroxyalkanoate synthesis repressor PhaR